MKHERFPRSTALTSIAIIGWFCLAQERSQTAAPFVLTGSSGEELRIEIGPSGSPRIALFSPDENEVFTIGFSQGRSGQWSGSMEIASSLPSSASLVLNPSGAELRSGILDSRSYLTSECLFFQAPRLPGGESWAKSEVEGPRLTYLTGRGYSSTWMGIEVENAWGEPPDQESAGD